MVAVLAPTSVAEFSRLSTQPEGFSKAPGDAMAYRCWYYARRKDDLQARSRLIGQGLKYAYSNSAQEQLQQLLCDFTVVKAKAAPRLWRTTQIII